MLKNQATELADVNRRLFFKEIPEHVATRLKFEIRAKYEKVLEKERETRRKAA